jgi:hypothetical protein
MVIKDKKMLSILKQPYPFYYYPDRLLRHSLTIVGFITLFLILFKPFNSNINELRFNYYITCVIYGIVASAAFLTTFSIIILCFPRFCKEEKWTVAKEILVMAILLFIIGNSNFFIRNLINTNPDNFRLAYYFEELIHTCFVGIIPIGFFIALNFSYLYKANTDKANISDSYISKKEENAVLSSPSIVTIVSQSIYETLSIDIHEIFFIRSDGNYIEIYQCENDILKKQIIRNTLKDIEKQLSHYPNIIKTHRSHLVNVNQICSVKGNAQGYTIHFKNCTETIPVSRNHISRFDEVIKELSL